MWHWTIGAGPRSCGWHMGLLPTFLPPLACAAALVKCGDHCINPSTQCCAASYTTVGLTCSGANSVCLSTDVCGTSCPAGMRLSCEETPAVQACTSCIMRGWGHAAAAQPTVACAWRACSLQAPPHATGHASTLPTPPTTAATQAAPPTRRARCTTASATHRPTASSREWRLL